MNYLPDAALFLLLVVALVAGGWAVSNREKSSLESAFLPLAAGLGAYAFAVWVVGSLWKLVPTLWILLPLPLLAFLVIAKRENLQFHARRTLAALRNLPRFDAALALYLAGVFALTFILSLAPPNAADYDSLTYHLAVPAQYLRAGKIVELPYDHHSYFPFTLEMLYTLGLAARGAVFAKLFHWLMLPLGALALLAIGKRAHSARAGLIAATLYASMPLVLVEATTAYIDLGFCAFAFLALLCFVGAPRQNRNENWLWCGAFCGFCIGTKYFGWLIFGFLGLWFLFQMLQKREFSTRKLALFALPALVLGAPWYLRNMMWTGNPVFPFAYGIFGGQGWTAQMAALYDSSQAIYGFGKSPLDAGWVFWRLAMTPLNFRQPFWPLSGELVAPPQTGIFEVAGLVLSSFPGPAVFALGLPALLGRKKPLSIVIATSLFAFLMVFWFVTSQQIRYLLPALGLLALVGGWGAAQNAPRFRVARWVGGAGLGLWLLFAPAWLVWHNRGSFGVLSGAHTPENYLRGFSGFDAMQWASNNTPPDAKFAVYGEPRTFYLHRNHFWADDGHNNLIAYATLQNGAQLALALKNLGATHVLWNTAPGQNGGVFGPPQPLMDDAIARGDLGLLYEDRRGYRIYALR